MLPTPAATLPSYYYNETSMQFKQAAMLSKTELIAERYIYDLADDLIDDIVAAVSAAYFDRHLAQHVTLKEA